jgi:hypothetical protein
MAREIHAVYDYWGILSVFTGTVVSRHLILLLVMAGGLALRFVLRHHPSSLKLYAVANSYEPVLELRLRKPNILPDATLG